MLNERVQVWMDRKTFEQLLAVLETPDPKTDNDDVTLPAMLADTLECDLYEARENNSNNHDDGAVGWSEDMGVAFER